MLTTSGPAGLIRATIIAVTLLAAPARAADPIDLLFNTPHLDQTDPSLTLRYAHTRSSTAEQVLGPALDSAILLRREEGRGGLETVITMDADGAGRQLDNFRGVPGNPILMVFMETLVSSLNRATGGSPFYIRNRLKEAFAKGEVGTGEAGQTILMRPFDGDRNAQRMGPFASLEIEMTLEETRPGMFGNLTARVRDEKHPEILHYFEEMRYVDAN